jgi:hypothetical protein
MGAAFFPKTVQTVSANTVWVFALKGIVFGWCNETNETYRSKTAVFARPSIGETSIHPRFQEAEDALVLVQ